MVSVEFQKYLDLISRDIIILEPELESDIEGLYSLINSLLDNLNEREHPGIYKGIRAAAVLVQNLMAGRAELGAEAVIDILGRLVTALQHATRPGADPAQIDIPPELSSEGSLLQAPPPSCFKIPEYIDAAIFNEFLNDQDGVLQNLESYLLKFEKNQGSECLSDLRRLFHTLKGEAGVFELQEIEKVCHAAEDLIDTSEEKLPIDVFLDIKDWMHSVFGALKSNGPIPSLPAGLGRALKLQAAEPQSGPAQAPADSGVFTLPSSMDEDIYKEFLSEQDNVLEKMEADILLLESRNDPTVLAELRRLFHTLKGESAIFELFDVEKICHAAEDLVESSPVFSADKLLMVTDWLGSFFDDLKNGRPLSTLDEKLLNTLMEPSVPDESRRPEKITEPRAEPDTDAVGAVVFGSSGEIKAFVDAVDPPRSSAAAPPPLDHDPPAAPAPKDKQKNEQYIISADVELLSDFVSEVQEHIENIDSRLLTLENNPQDQDLLNAVFRVFHTIKGAAGFLTLEDISRLAHTTENLLDLARKGDLILSGRSIDVVFEAIDEMKKLVGNIESAISSGAASYPTETSVNALIEKIGQVIAARGDVRSGDAESKKPPEICVEPGRPEAPAAPVPDMHLIDEHQKNESTAAHRQTGAVPSESAEEPAGSDDDLPQSAVPQARSKIKESIKVDSENLDKLIDAIGELVIIESMIHQEVEVKSASSSTLAKNITQMDKITRELQQLCMALRMIPVRATFQKMARVVRDLAKKGNKNIEFVVQGEDTMLDKSVVDRIGDPLIHLVRNSVDHGIETSDVDRIEAGKSATGIVELIAFHKGGNIHIEIKDDGRGLDKDAILKKALEKGLVREGQSLSDREIYNLIFLPGFSTAQKVTDVSGRGVGMDVVKRTIEDLRGNVEIMSDPGKGTVFSLRLPLTLAIIDGMLVRIGTERYIIPTLSIVESVRPRRKDISTIATKGEMISIRDKLIPLFRLADLFKIQGAKANPTDGIVIVVEDSGKMTGILVDELLGQQSTVIKSLGSYLKGLPGVSGGSIMSDGRVGIIVDIAGIVKLATIGQHSE